MNLKDLEFTAERLANATLFGEGEREALKTARDLIIPAGELATRVATLN